ncbi:uncharacterized protein LOC127122751 [Lathyrus oleraceus]|uniref:uncharacterized protein LOC127122751 n=1 Tax=Pisum sativum TaxID=3888 RepID=UPI0021CEBBAC|nr:uncharacterized protein LOC127122751 [Pisum sativum]
MASSNKPSAAKLTQPITIDGREYVHEPPVAEEKAKTWRSQSYFAIYVGAPEAKLFELTQAFVYLQAKSTKSIPLDPVGPTPAREPTPSTQEGQVALEKSSDDDERPIAQVLKKPSSSAQQRSTDPTVSSHSNKSKKHNRSTGTGSEVFPVGLSDLLARIFAYNLSSYLHPTSQPSSLHKSKSHHGHKGKKHDSASRSGEGKRKKHHKEAPAVDVDTIMVDTSILDKVPDPVVGFTIDWPLPCCCLGERKSGCHLPCVDTAIPLDPMGPTPAREPTPLTQEAQAAPEKSSDNYEGPIAQVLKKPSSSGQQHSTDPTLSSHSKKSKKHKRSTGTGSEVFPVGLSDLLARIFAYNLSSYLQPTSQPSSLHKSKSHHGHKRKKHDSPSSSGEGKRKKHHKEAPAVDVDTIMVNTSILDKVPDPVMGASQSTDPSPAAALGKENQDAISPASTQEPRGPADVDTNKTQPSQTTPPSTASPSSQTTPLSVASPLSFPGLAIKPSALEAIARLRNLVKSRDASSDSEQLHSGKMGY